MADPEDIEANKYELEDLAVVPGTYFNPQTEVVVIVDDSVTIGQDVFNLEEYEGSDWGLKYVPGTTARSSSSYLFASMSSGSAMSGFISSRRDGMT